MITEESAAVFQRYPIAMTKVFRATEYLLESPAHSSDAQPKAKLITYSPGPYLVDLSMFTETRDGQGVMWVRLEGYVSDDEGLKERSGEVTLTSTDPSSLFGPYEAVFKEGFTFKAPQGEYDVRITITETEGEHEAGEVNVHLELPGVAVTPLLLSDWKERESER